MEMLEKMRNGIQFYVDFEHPNVILAKKPKRVLSWISNFLENRFSKISER